MKKISAIICELNPLHDGHRYVFSEAKKNGDVLIAIMSGNFVQRGETSVYDKYARADAALSAGADIVLELPFPYSSSSAEYFARAGVRIAEAVGADSLYFGSECGDIKALQKCADILSSDEYKKAMTVGRSAKIRGEIIKDLDSDLPETVLNSPNDILGAEYCRWITRMNPVPVKRISTESASSIRERSLLQSNTDMLDPKRLFELEYIYFRIQKTALNNIAECGGGVYERLLNTAFSSVDFKEWVEAIKTKQYTNSRLRRAALFALCGVKSEALQNNVAFTVLLGANPVGREYLADIRKNCEFPIITKVSDSKFLNNDAMAQYELSKFADSIYTLCKGNMDPAFFVKSYPVIHR